MADEDLARGDVVVAALPEQVPSGHEQVGLRPAVVVGLPARPARYPVLVLVPLTTRRGPWAESNPQLYPVLAAGSAGLPRASTALCDQVRACDEGRLRVRLGRLDEEAFGSIRQGLRILLNLP